MIGSIIEKIRIEKNILKTDLANIARINVGHLSHIEKGQRNPSEKTLKLICNGLDVPFEPLMHVSDVELTDEQIDYNAVKHFKYDSIPIVDSISGFAVCPSKALNASIILKANDDSMSPKIGATDFMYLQLYVPLSNKDIGLFLYDNNLLIRKFIIRKNDIVLRPENSDYNEIVVNKNSDFYILGKVIGKNNEKMDSYSPFF